MKSVKDLYSIISALKTTKRQGWLYKKMDSDVIASHIYGAMCVGMYLAKVEGVDIDKVIRMLLVHDWVMAKMEDVTPPSGKYDQKRQLEDQAKDVVAELLPEVLQDEYLGLFQEFNDQITAEAQVAREADKLETLFQGEVFEETTGDTKVLDTFFETYASFFKTANGKKLFDELRKRDLERKKLVVKV